MEHTEYRACMQQDPEAYTPACRSLAELDQCLEDQKALTWFKRSVRYQQPEGRLEALSWPSIEWASEWSAFERLT